MIRREVIDGYDTITLTYRDFNWKCGEKNFFNEIARLYPSWGFPVRMIVERTIGDELFTWEMVFDDSPDPRSNGGQDD